MVFKAFSLFARQPEGLTNQSQGHRPWLYGVPTPPNLTRGAQLRMLETKSLSCMNKKVLLLFGVCFLVSGLTFGQLKKTRTDPYLWPEVGVDYFLKNQSYFFFRSQFRHNTDSDIPGISDSGPFSKFYQVYLLLGYDQKLTEHWRTGLAARYTFDRNNDQKMIQGMLQHNGKIGKTDFIKRLTYDYLKPELGESSGRIRPIMALERNFKLGDHILRPHVSYELFFYQDFNSDETTTDARLVDRTRLRLAVSYKATQNLWITPYFLKQTEYFNVISTFTPQLDANGKEVLDSDGNVILIENKGGKRNLIQPIFGLELRFLLPGRHLSETTVPNLGALSETSGQ
jgi:hypothetical protein